MGEGATIEVRGLGRQFGEFWALRDVNLRVESGSVTVIIGGSGAGKSTLLRLLIGLDRPTTGSIIFDGQDIAGLNETAMNKLRRGMGMVFQYSALLDSLTVFENVAFPLREHRRELSEKEIRARVLEKLLALDLRGIEQKLPSELSGGMRKRTALARALMLEPKALFYDEPTSGLDPLSARLVDRLILETRDKFGVTSVVISHDMTGAMNIADRIHLISDGQINASGTPSELAHGQHPLAQAFFEASGMRLNDSR
jgi:phospholipid/cholesterol/gamma-HCH transport system ATP-binding protein